MHNQINAMEIAKPSSANVSGVMSKDMLYLSVTPSNFVIVYHSFVVEGSDWLS